MSRRKWLIPGCAILALLIVVVIIATVPAALALRLAGFRSQGDTAEILDERGSLAAPTIAWSPSVDGDATLDDGVAPADGAGGAQPSPGGPQTLDAVTVDLWFLAQPRTVPSDQLGADRLERGQTEAGATAYYIEFDEAGANAQLDRWFGEYVAAQSRLRDPAIDLKPGGAIVYADVDLELGWQRVGAVLMVDATGRQIQVVGVDIGGRLYSTPPDGQIAEMVQRVESEANRALRELAFVDDAGQLIIRAISVDETRAQILAY
jgi:hypothetical protein